MLSAVAYKLLPYMDYYLYSKRCGRVDAGVPTQC